MKVGTDSVLLGAWAKVKGARKILDIGTGSGLLAIMMAQRNSIAEIHGVEIEKNSYEQAIKNATECPWKNRLNMIHSSIQKFASDQPQLYDIIITNPPFFNTGVQPSNISRATARHTNYLSQNELANAVSILLSTQGEFYCILPPREAKKIIEIASKKHLFLNHIVKLSPSIRKPSHRLMMRFSRTRRKIIEERMVINAPGSREYSDAYKSLTKEFYLYK